MAVERILLPQPSAPAAPYTFSLSGDETLLIRVWCGRFGSAPNPVEAVTVDCRFVKPDGTFLLTGETIAPTTNRLVNSRYVPLGVGTLQDLTVQWAGATTQTGLCYVAVYIVRGRPPGSTRIVAQLVGGYVKPGQGLAWPGSPIADSLEGLGYPHTIDAGAVAAGAEASFVLPSGAVWAALSVYGVLTSDATAATRRPTLTLADSSGLRLMQIFANTLAPGFACVYTWAVNATASDLGNVSSLRALPSGFVLHGGTIATLTLQLQPGDQWSDVHLYTTEWLEASA